MLANRSIKNRLIIGFVIILIFVITFSAGLTIYRSVELTGRLLGNQALTAAEQAIRLVSVDKLEKVIKSMNDHSPEYVELQKKLADYRHGQEIKYLYIMAKTSGEKFIYLVDGLYQYEKGFSKLGVIEKDESEYDDFNKVMDGDIVVSKILFSNHWGKLVSAYIPIKDKYGDVIGFLGVDLEASNMLTMIRENTITTFAYIIIVFIFGVFAVSFLAFRLTKPIVQLRNHFTDLTDETDIQPYNIKSKNELSDIANILNKKIESVRTILNNTGEGLMMIGPSLVPNKECSSESRRILHRANLDNVSFPELIYPDDLEQQILMSDVLRKIFEEVSVLRRKSYISLLPKEVELYGRFIKLEYKAISSKDMKNRMMIMVIMKDMTDNKILEQKVENERKLLEMVANTLIHINEIADLMQVYRTFCNFELRNMIDSDREIEEISYDIFREIHTFKRDFGVYGLYRTVEKLHNVENDIIEAQKQCGQLSKEKIRDYFAKIKPSGFIDEDMETVRGIVGDNVVDRILGIERSVLIDYKRLRKVEEAILNKFGQEQGMSAVKEIRKLQYRYFSDLFNSYPEYVERVSERLEKLVYMTMDGGKFLVDAEIYKEFIDSLVHIFRNAVDHGIELPEDRIALGKDEYGCISCGISRNNGRIVLEISDDGCGIDLDKLCGKAVKKGIITANEVCKMSKDEIKMLIFKDEMSTKEEVSVISGRGIGLSAFMSKLKKLDGNVKVMTEAGVGTTFIIDLPDLEEVEVEVEADAV